jgi:hypothetical protein
MYSGYVRKIHTQLFLLPVQLHRLDVQYGIERTNILERGSLNSVLAFSSSLNSKAAAEAKNEDANPTIKRSEMHHHSRADDVP